MRVRRKTRSRRSGFTLIEMLAATVVLSMLLVALVGISRASARQARRADSLRTRFPSTGILEDQIVRDIRNADGFLPLNNGVTLFGAISSNPVTGAATHRLARVSYVVRRLRGLRVLVRIEQLERGAGHGRIVWIGTGGLVVSSIGVVTGQETDAQLTGGLSPMPTMLSVQLYGEDGNTIWSQRIRHHMEVR